MFGPEVALDELAEQLGIDPVELRIRNEPDVGELGAADLGAGAGAWTVLAQVLADALDVPVTRGSRARSSSAA
jgi:CO/xanthine dehydrogenase Mo-binding subunit